MLIPETPMTCNIISRFLKMRMKNKIFLSYIAVISLVIFLVGWFNYSQVKKVLLNEERMILEQALIQTSEAVSNKLLVIDGITYSLSKNQVIYELFGMNDKTKSEVNAYISGVIPFFYSYHVGNSAFPEFCVYMNTPSISTDEKYFKPFNHVNKEKWFKDILNDKSSVYWRDKFKQKNAIWDWKQDDYIACYRKITFIQQTRPDIIVEAKIPLLFFNIDFKSVDTSRLGKVYLLDNSGNIVLSNSSRNDNIEGILEIIRTDIPTGSHLAKVNGEEKLIAYTKLRANGWRLVSLIPSETIYKQINFIKYTNLATIFLGLVLAGLVAYFISGLLVGRLSQLAAKIKSHGSSIHGVRYSRLKGISLEDEIKELDMGFNSMIDSIEHLVQNEYSLERSKRQLQLNLLMEQINPHFLYNTLSCIKWEAASLGNDTIGRVTDALIRFYRLNLSSGNEFITVSEEFEMIRQYIDIFKFTYEKEFEVVYNLDAETGKYPMMKFVLQPIVENSLLHGIYGMDKGLITISAAIEGENLLITVADNGSGMSLEQAEGLLNQNGKGFGIRNINERIQLTYGDHYGLEVLSRENCGTVVKVMLRLDLR